MNLRDMKIVWGRSGNRCAVCKCELVADALVPTDDASIIGDMAHIVARKPTFTRGDYATTLAESRVGLFERKLFVLREVEQNSN
jgi:hypothetical protein